MAGEQVAPNVCAACKSARYCGVECQRKDWKLHKPACKMIAGFASRKAAVVAADKTIKPYDKESIEKFRAIGALRGMQPEGAVVVSWTTDSAYGHYLGSDALVDRIDTDGTSSGSAPLLPGHSKETVFSVTNVVHYHIYTRNEFQDNGWLADEVKVAVELFFSHVNKNGCAWVNCLPDQLHSVWFGTLDA